MKPTKSNVLTLVSLLAICMGSLAACVVMEQEERLRHLEYQRDSMLNQQLVDIDTLWNNEGDTVIVSSYGRLTKRKMMDPNAARPAKDTAKRKKLSTPTEEDPFLPWTNPLKP